MTNISQIGRTKPSSLGVSPFLGGLPRELLDRQRDFFVYTADFLPLAAGATTPFETAIQADSDFLCIAGVRQVLTTAAPPVGVPVSLQTVQLIDTGSGRTLSDRAVPLDNWFGTGQLPMYWPSPKLFRASSTITTTLTNLDAATAFTIRISFLGFKIFGYRG